MRSLFLLTLFLALDFTFASKAAALRRAIFSNYDPLVKPDGQVVFKKGFVLLNLHYCPHKQNLKVQGWSFNDWVDSRLTWDPSDWGNMTRLQISAKELWLPDVTPYDIGTRESNYLGWESTTKAVIMNTGRIIFVPPVTFSTLCPSDDDAHSESADWRFLERNCSISFGSWTYHIEDMDVVPGDYEHRDTIDTRHFTNKRVQILDTFATRSEPEYPCCPGEKYPMVTFNIRFKNLAVMTHKGKVIREGQVEEDGGESDSDED